MKTLNEIQIEGMSDFQELCAGLTHHVKLIANMGDNEMGDNEEPTLMYMVMLQTRMKGIDSLLHGIKEHVNIFKNELKRR